MKKVMIGLLVAPLFPAVVAALGILGATSDTETASGAAFMCLLGGYVAALCVGLPLSFAWKHFGWTQVVGGIALGMISAGALTLTVTLLLSLVRQGEVSLLRGLVNLLVVTLPLGAVGGLAFWWFGLRSAGGVRAAAEGSS